jgi:hypothetical protein
MKRKRSPSSPSSEPQPHPRFPHLKQHEVDEILERIRERQQLCRRMKEIVYAVLPGSDVLNYILDDDHVSIENRWTLDPASSISMDLECGLRQAFESDAHQILTRCFLPALTVDTLP